MIKLEKDVEGNKTEPYIEGKRFKEEKINIIRNERK
jgi:hypothetical protein